MDPPVIMNIKKIRRLMKKYGLVCPVRKANPHRRTAVALKTRNVAANLLQREFECYGPRMVLLTDVTYLPYKGKFAYLSTIIDAYTKQILSYVLSEKWRLISSVRPSTTLFAIMWYPSIRKPSSIPIKADNILAIALFRS